MDYRVLKNIPDLHKIEKGIYISGTTAGKNGIQQGTAAALPNEQHLKGAGGFAGPKKKK